MPGYFRFLTLLSESLFQLPGGGVNPVSCSLSMGTRSSGKLELSSSTVLGDLTPLPACMQQNSLSLHGA
jgi:hypothetical protein